MMALLLGLAAAQACGSSGVQAELNACAQRDFEAADRRLNAQWRITLAKLRAEDRGNGRDGFGPPTADVLLKSQRAWLAFRDAQCDLMSQEARGGSMQPMLYAGCRAKLTDERTQSLKQVIERR